MLKYDLNNLLVVSTHDCYTSCIATMASHYGIVYPGGVWFYLINGTDMPYQRIRDTNDIEQIARYSVPDDSKFININLEHIKITHMRHFKSNNVRETIKKVIEENGLLLLCCTTHNLTYHDVFVKNKPMSHCMLISKIDLNTDMISVVDPFVMVNISNIQTFSGKIPFQEVSGSLQSVCEVKIFPNNLSDMTIVNMTVKTIEKFCGVNSTNISGAKWLQDYIDDLRYLKKLHGSLFTDRCIYAAFSISNSHFVIMISYLIETILYLKDYIPNVNDLVAELHNLYDSWINVRFLFQKSGFTGRKKLLDDALQICKELVTRETNIMLFVLEALYKIH